VGSAHVLPANSASAQVSDSQPARRRFTQQYYPMPSYLPPGFVLVGVHTDPPEGFQGDLTEIRFLYQNLSVLPVGKRIKNPLMIFMTPKPQVTFGTARSHVGKAITFTMISGDTVSAEYHDGMWVLAPDGERVAPNGVHTHWTSENAHVLVFKWHDLSVGILGSRLTGVDYDALIRIASSLNGYWPAPPPGISRSPGP
jgi:hypothetical protein